MRVRLRAEASVPAPRQAEPAVEHAAAQPAAPSGRRSMRHEIAEGLRWLFRHRLLRTLAALLAITNMATNVGWSTLVLFARNDLHVGSRWYGVLLATSAVGGVLGGLTAQRIVRKLGTRRSIIAASGVGALGTAMIAVLVHNAYAMAACLTITSFAAVNWNVSTVSLRQRVIPDHIRGRVNSAYRLAAWGSIPIGALAGGFVANEFGLRAPWYLGAAMRLSVFASAVLLIRARDFASAETSAG
jgi:predicted MFS family arabinose efflux permease